LVASARTAVKDRSPLRGAPLVPHSASLTASSLRLRFFHRGAGAPRFFVALNSYFMNFPWSRKGHAASKKSLCEPRSAKFFGKDKGAPLCGVNFECCFNLSPLRKERSR